MDNLIMKYGGLVRYVVNRFKNFGSIEDLFQVGVIGLMRAHKNYKESEGTKFSTYAYTYIYGEIYKYINDDRSIRINHDVVKLNRLILKTKEILTQKFQRDISNDEVSHYLEIDVDKVNDAISYFFPIKSLDYNVDEDCELYNFISENDNMTRAELIDLRNEIESLNDFEKKLILSRYFGGYTQDEVSKMLGISQVKVSREEKKVLIKLRNGLE